VSLALESGARLREHRDMNRNALIPIAGFVLLASSCGGSSVSSARVVKLEQRVAKVEAQNAAYVHYGPELRLVALRLAKLDKRARANEQALYVGVSAAQYNIACGPGGYQSSCHIPVGSPGAVYTLDGRPGRIFTAGQAASSPRRSRRCVLEPVSK
jgi:hypothetical protein